MAAPQPPKPAKKPEPEQLPTLPLPPPGHVLLPTASGDQFVITGEVSSENLKRTVAALEIPGRGCFVLVTTEHLTTGATTESLVFVPQITVRNDVLAAAH
jgi:hypothetical protein